MSDTKLNQSLDEILSTQRRNNGRRGGRVRRTTTSGHRTATIAPAAGVKKNVRGTKASTVAIPTGPSGGNGDSRIQVSNLPKDVSENQIKEYFGKSVGPIKRVEISYGPGGLSRGVATISFKTADGASKAVDALNGLLVDGRPMKIDVLLDARRAAAIPPPKGLSERILPAKSQPKSALAKKTDGATGTGTRGKKIVKKGRSGRPSKKTAEELDSEMADYFEQGVDGEGGPANGAQTAATGDAAMDDEVL